MRCGFRHEISLLTIDIGNTFVVVFRCEEAIISKPFADPLQPT